MTSSPIAALNVSTEIISWPEARHLVSTGQIELLRRNADQKRTYDRWASEARQYYASIGDYIKHVVFGWPCEEVAVDESASAALEEQDFVLCDEQYVPSINGTFDVQRPPAGRRWRACRPSSPSSSLRQQIILRQNDFPYYLTPGLIHYILWANRDLSEQEMLAYLRVSLGEGVFKYQRVVWFINPPAKRSIPEVWHAHVILQSSML